MAIQRETRKHNQFGGVVAGAQHRRPAEGIALEAAHQEAIEQPRHQRVLQVQVHPIGIDLLRITEHHRLQLGLLPPLPQLLARRARRPQGVEHIPPHRFSTRELLSGWELPDRPIRIGCRFGWIPWLQLEAVVAVALATELQAGVERIAEVAAAEVQPFPGTSQITIQGAHLFLQLLFALTAALQLFINESAGDTEVVELVEPLDLSNGVGQGRGVDALGQQFVEFADHHRRQAAQFGADLVGLAHHRVEHRVFRSLGQHEVVAKHLGRPLQGAVDAAVALLHPARVPGHIEVH